MGWAAPHPGRPAASPPVRAGRGAPRPPECRHPPPHTAPASKYCAAVQRMHGDSAGGLHFWWSCRSCVREAESCGATSGTAGVSHTFSHSLDGGNRNAVRMRSAHGLRHITCGAEWAAGPHPHQLPGQVDKCGADVAGGRRCGAGDGGGRRVDGRDPQLHGGGACRACRGRHRRDRRGELTGAPHQCRHRRWAAYAATGCTAPSYKRRPPSSSRHAARIQYELCWRACTGSQQTVQAFSSALRDDGCY